MAMPMIVGNRLNGAPSKWVERANHDGNEAVISCHQLIEFCLDYIDGALPDAEQVGFRRHLAQCPDCVTFFETYQKTPEISREALSTKIPASVRESVRTFLQLRRGE
jgi:anti-sigma factor RsiW